MMNRINQARRAYNSAVTPGAEGMQNALANLLGGGHPIEGTSLAGKMAASPEMLALLKAMPAVGAAAVGGSALATAGDLVTGDPVKIRL